MHITVVIPTYNEIDNLGKLVTALFSLDLPDLSLLVVDDNSPDGSGEFAGQLAADNPNRIGVIHRAGKLGLGTAYITGFQQALNDGADAVIQMDADFSHPVEKIPELIQTLDECDVVIGSRYVPGGAVDERWPAWRKGLSAFGNFYARTILRLPVRDATAGFRIWRRQVLETMPLQKVRANGYAFQVEMIYIAYRLGYRIQEIPIYFADRRWGTSKMSFQIQKEAALRVWQILFEYRNLRRLHP
ncbi:MAG: polyprenol monophosphomannose synthase [Anaerolineales bacterium]|nr:polyprenol monophosphomannose synthase [Anaerolineales bacterium]